MPRVFLIGPMGGGKSTIGVPLAKALSYEFRDTDKEIEQRTGVQISLIFELEGESGFRVRESAIIEELTQLDRFVLATGGGAALMEGNRQVLKERGFVVYLHASIDHLLARTSKDKNRPLLVADNPREKLIELATVRTPLYESIADMTVDTSEGSVRDIVTHITEAVIR